MMHIPPLIFGNMANRQSDDQSRITLFHYAVDIGITTFDTAPLYEFGRAERQLGEAFGNSVDVQVFTKVGLRWGDDARGDILFEFTDEHGHRRAVRKDSRPEAVRLDVEESLRRLNRDTLDLVQIHHPDVYTPIDETMGVLLDLKAAGKIRQIGVSNFMPAQIENAQQALGETPIATLQPDYSLLNRYIEREIVDLCQHKGIRIISYSPLAHGLLAKSPGRQLPRRIRNAVHTLTTIARNHDVSPAVIALAWVCHQPGISAPIFGASNQSQLEELVGATSVHLSQEALAELDDAFSEWRMASIARKAKMVVKRLLGRGG
ncbi:MAG: aldo/keto reductase [Pseudomonadota bacterium]